MHDGDSPEETWDVFLSFATADQHHAEELKERLEGQGWKVFLAHKSVGHGADWQELIPSALQNSRLVAVLLSAQTAQAPYQNGEIIRAIRAKKSGEVELVPIYLEGEPESLPNWGFGLEGCESLDLSRLSMREIATRLGDQLEDLGPPVEEDSGERRARGSWSGWGNPWEIQIGERQAWASLAGGAVVGILALLVVTWGASGLWFVDRSAPPQSQESSSSTENTSALEGDRSDDPSNALGPEMIRIPGGTFEMRTADGDDDERPVHTVTVASFEISKTEVTVAQYRICVEDGGCAEPRQGFSCNWGVEGKDNHPVHCVSWDNATAYAEWFEARLPTEAEWEYAARSGGLDRDYPWGDTEPTCDLVVFSRCGSGTQPVCSKTAGNTEQKLCDMSGNVWEWVEDDWHSNYAGAPEDGSAWVDSPRASSRVVRGGSWVDYPQDARVAVRVWAGPSYRKGYLGFRVARSLPSSLCPFASLLKRLFGRNPTSGERSK